LRRVWAFRDGKVVEITGEVSQPKETRGPNIIPDIQPYKAVGIDGSWVTSRSHHRALLKQHGMIEVGNEQPKWMKKEGDGHE
jgi:hypothetical protein